MISHARLREVLHYDPATGSFTWRLKTRKTTPGAPAGWVDESGYLHIRIDRTLYPAHRLAWLYMTGGWPQGGFIDHRNTITSDNRWENLRAATKRLNQENRRRAGRNNKAGLLGVSPNGARWAASIVSHRKKHHLGTFDTPSQAHRAYVMAKRQLHQGCTL